MRFHEAVAAFKEWAQSDLETAPDHQRALVYLIAEDLEASPQVVNDAVAIALKEIIGEKSFDLAFLDEATIETLLRRSYELAPWITSQAQKALESQLKPTR